MIHILWPGAATADLETATALTAGLRSAGLPAGLLASALPDKLTYGQSCDVAPLIASGPPGPGDRLLFLGGQKVGDADLSSLRHLERTGLAGCLVTGTFGSLQAEIGVRARFTYALGTPPDLFPLPTGGSPSLLAHPDAPVFASTSRRLPASDGRLRVLLVAPNLAQGIPAAAFQAIALARRLAVTILTDGKSKDTLRAAGVTAPIYHYSEAPFAAHIGRSDVAVFCQPVASQYAMRNLLAGLALSGVALLDSSPGFANRKLEPAFVPAPADPAALAAFLTGDIRDELAELARLSQTSTLAAQADRTLCELRRALGEERVPAGPRPAQMAERRAPTRVVFLPTNGVGLGHAQRCTLIAEALSTHSPARPVFAAFPSCMRLIKSRGFDVMPLVQKTGRHEEPLANDIVNYARLGPLLRDAAAFVFDGGYVFNSIFRSILDHGLPAVWIRRGLWRAGQDNSIALEREKVFDRVIVPQEAFDDLNEDYSHGPRIRKVGPIVRRIALSTDESGRLREGLAEQFGSFERLVVTMLGGGVASDRSAQTAAIAAGLARRPDVLHLVVTWPTATVDPGHFAWPNTHVVRTHHASILAAAADLFISAVGYNSFHEAMYNRIPTVFIPQEAAFMDDQRARALAARERGLAELVDPHQLMTLDRTITRMLDGGEADTIRARLTGIGLPSSGNAAAAECIHDLALRGAPNPIPMPVRRIA